MTIDIDQYTKCNTRMKSIFIRYLYDLTDYMTRLESDNISVKEKFIYFYENVKIYDIYFKHENEKLNIVLSDDDYDNYALFEMTAHLVKYKSNKTP